MPARKDYASMKQAERLNLHEKIVLHCPSMTVPAVPSPTCEVTWLENGQIVTDGLPAVVVGYFHPAAVSHMVPMTSLCAYHYQVLNPRELATGVWSFTPISTPAPPGTMPNPNIQAPPRISPDRTPSFWALPTTQWRELIARLREILKKLHVSNMVEIS